MTTPIPIPPTVPFLGNVPLVDKQLPMRTFMLLAAQYGEIYGFQYPDGRVTVHINTHALLAQVSDDKRFKKLINSSLHQVRNLAGDGLFTALGEEESWTIAHRILMPAFGAGNVLHMFDDMRDICDQLLLKWERFGPDNVFDPSDDYTRLTFDTIALSSMSHRFNSFYEPDMPPFTKDMVDVLSESSNRAFRGPLARLLPILTRRADDEYFEKIAEMKRVAAEIVEKRKANPLPEGKRDLLTLMLDGREPKSGKGLSDESIIYNLLTFLIAGHETTSGMLTFATYYLLKNPAALRALREELDGVVGVGGDVQLEHLARLPYLVAVMRETLRLSPTAPIRTIGALADTTLVGGDGDAANPANRRYEVKAGQMISVQAIPAMRDTRVWGEDAEEFRPERMLGGKFEELPFQAWQPFGYGMRACIGRAFAWQEAQLVLASIFAKFDVFLADPGYTLQIKQALTIKPKDMRVRVALRSRPSTGTSVEKPVKEPMKGNGNEETETETEVGGRSAGTPLYVFYGSNTGTSEGFAGRVASDAAAHGFKASLQTLDIATAHLPTDGPVVIVTASYEGEPADNAAQFVGWLQSLAPSQSSSSLQQSKQKGQLEGVRYVVFGCGSREWARTYQRVPALVDTLLEARGAERLMKRGEADAGGAGFFQDFEDFEGKMWGVLDEKYGFKDSNGSVSATAPTETLSVEIVDAGTTRAKLLRQPDAAMGKVVENRLLTKPGTPEKRHIEIELPEGMAYRAGDYLAILPTNPVDTVKRALSLFGLSGEQEVIIKSEGPTTFPVDTPTPVHTILSGFVELTQPATTRDLLAIQTYAKSDASIAAIAKLRDNYQDEIVPKRLSVLDILEQHTDIALPFPTFLRLLPPMRVRQYSISSSPLIDPQHVTLTISVLAAPALSGTGGTHLGVASTYLASLRAGDRLLLAVRPSSAAFHLPGDPATPVVMFCAGTGLAPFRGFVQERAAQKKAGRDVGKMLLFFGCRDPEVDYLYGEGELGEWVREGVVDVRPAFSRREGGSKGCKYVQDRVWHDREDVDVFFRANAKFYTCGSRKASNGIKKACVDMIKANRNVSEEDAVALFEKVQKERYATDVFD